MAMSDIILRDKSKQMGGTFEENNSPDVDEKYMCDFVLNAGL